jgi:DNA-binding MarR family transcriptional regulator
MANFEEVQHRHNRENFRQALKSLFGVEDTRGMEIFTAMHRIAHRGEMLAASASDEADLSGPRWRLLVRMLVEEQMGNVEGITPTDLSHWQRVSKNTISSLLRGLEEQGLVRRTLDSKDLRVFRIQLTDTGRDLVRRNTPHDLERMNRLLKGLEPEEIDQLNNLLDKLLDSILVQLHSEIKEQNRN